MALARRNYYSLTGAVEMLTQHGSDRAAWTRAQQYLAEAERLRDDSLDRERLGREEYLRGFLAFRLGDLAGSDAAFRRSLAIDAGDENAARVALEQLGRVRAGSR